MSIFPWAWLHLNDTEHERGDAYLVIRPRWERLIRWPLATWRTWRVVDMPLHRVAWECLKIALMKVTP